MDKYIGQLLDNRYEILERVGVGGMAVVYKARCHRLNRLVAVKILREEMAGDAEIRRRFHDESKAVAMLSHPNIVAVYDVSRSSELDYIVMELIDGITLKQYMQRKGNQLSWKESLHFITQIMRALSHAHSRGIIHRDIKPHNIMVLRDGSVKVADFGIARLTAGGDQQEGMTQEALGSVHYISPEQARGSRIDARSDIYSAGVVLYEMLTGRRPYEGETPMAVAIQHIKSMPLPPREIDPEIPEALEEIVLKAMAPDVERRYVSADAMLADLEEFRKNPSINFDYERDIPRDEDEDEPTMILGANTPHVVHSVPAHEEGEDDHDRRRGVATSTWVTAGAIVVLLIGVAVFLWVTFFSGLLTNDRYPVPKLDGMTLEMAQQLESVQSAKLQIREGERVASDTYPAGEIISQSPDVGETISEGGVITVTVSSGPEDVVMPPLFNIERRIAEKRLNNLNLDLNIQIVTEESDTITKDYVIRQEPAANTVLYSGQNVMIVVSLGPKVPDVPLISFERTTLEWAKAQLEILELEFGGVKEAYSDTVEAGLIISQEPADVTSVPKGTKIYFTVSLGPEHAVLPPDPTPSPSPTTEQPPDVRPVVSKEIVVTLPNDGRETVDIRIQVGNNEWAYYRKNVDTKLRTAYCTVVGSGSQPVTIFIDEVAISTFAEVFE